MERAAQRGVRKPTDKPISTAATSAAGEGAAASSAAQAQPQAALDAMAAAESPEALMALLLQEAAVKCAAEAATAQSAAVAVVPSDERGEGEDEAAPPRMASLAQLTRSLSIASGKLQAAVVPQSIALEEITVNAVKGACTPAMTPTGSHTSGARRDSRQSLFDR